MLLKDLVAKKILDDILGPLFKLGEWRILVTDQLATSIVSSCCRMHDVMNKGITLVEGLEKSREPQLARETIYIIWPCEESLTKILMDFNDGSRVYKAAHVFLLDRLPHRLMSKLQESPARKYIKTLKECFIGFLPKESRVFTLNFPESFQPFFSPGSVGKGEMKTRIADQLATLCATLGEFPAIRCHKAVDGIEDIAHELYKRLEEFKMQSPSFAMDEIEKRKSQLIILDRGFDVVSPLVHELTYQAMVYDLLGIKRDIYTYEASTEGGGTRSREVILDESDPVWVQLRHEFISNVTEKVKRMVKEFADSKSKSPAASEDMSIKKLHQMVKKIPQNHKELSKLSRHLSMVERCDKKLKTGMFDLCKAEQDLAIGETETGERIENAMSLTTPILFDRKIEVYEKVRLMMLQLLFSQGEGKEGFTKLIQQVEIPPRERRAILNLTCLGHRVLKDVKAEGTVVKGERRQLRRKERMEEERRVVSRWIPVIQDIMEFAIEGRLDESYCPVLSHHPGSSSHSLTSSHPAPTGMSVRSDRGRWNWVSKKKGATASSSQDDVIRPRLILFVVGGVTYSEMRAAYEVTRKFPTHDVLIGSTHIITPGDFIGQLNELENPYKGKI